MTAPQPAATPNSAAARAPRRVVVVYDFGFINGGAAQVAIQSALGLAERGHKVDYFCAVGPPDPSLSASGVTVTCLGTHEFVSDPNTAGALAAGLWKPSAARALERCLAGADRDDTIIHVHGWTKAFSASVLAAALRSRIPCVTTLHEYFSVCPNGGFYDYQGQKPCGKRAMSMACVAMHCDSRSYPHKVWRVVRQLITAQAAGLPGALKDVIYISDFSRGVLQPYFPADTRWRMVPNPIHVEPGPRVEAERNEAFVFLGRISPEKGAELFAEAATRAGRAGRIIGDGPDREQIARQWPMIDLPGWMARDEVQVALGAARALVFPSRWYETQGLSVYEALARGVPVIVSDGCAARDAVVEGVNGFLFASGDAGDLAAKIALLSDPVRAEAMSRFAYGRATQTAVSMQVHLDALVDAYAQVMAAQD